MTTQKEPQPTPLLSTREAMVIFGYRSRSAFHKWIRTAGIPVIQLSPRRLAFDRSAIERWKIEHTTEGGVA